MPKFSQQEDDYLRENYKTKTNSRLAEELNRHPSSVQNRLRELNLKKRNKQLIYAPKGVHREGYQYTNHSNWNTLIDTPCCLLMPCCTCKELKPCDDFYIRGKSGKKWIYSKSTKQGVEWVPVRGRRDIFGNPRTAECKDCARNNYVNKTSQEKKLVYSARQRANRKGMECTIQPEDIVIPGNCPILGIELKPETGNGRCSNDNAPSLDRVDNSIGYTKENVIVISKRANTIKGDAELYEILSIAAYIAEFEMGKKEEVTDKVPYCELSLGEIANILLEYEEYLISASS